MKRLVVSLTLAAAVGCVSDRDNRLPASLSDEEFWSLVTTLSEPPGTFEQSDNLVSNELGFAQALRVLQPAGGVYVGVGPEQNFSYIARLAPALAFIIDIRRENQTLHLLYKALFEMSVDRADFVARLFSRERPDGLGRSATVFELFRQYAVARPSDRLYRATLQRVRRQLLDTRRLPLSLEELSWIDGALAAFFREGPDIDYYHRSRPLGPVDPPSYRTLMTATDMFGEPRSYLASEEAFLFVKAMHERNLIVPIVGDFGRAEAIERVGRFVHGHGGAVTAFYGSNVEIYLDKAGHAVYCRALAALPAADGARFIDSRAARTLRAKLASCPPPASASTLR